MKIYLFIYILLDENDVDTYIYNVCAYVCVCLFNIPKSSRNRLKSVYMREK